MDIQLTNNAYSASYVNFLRWPGQPNYQLPKSRVLNLSQLIKSCGTGTVPAGETTLKLRETAIIDK